MIKTVTFFSNGNTMTIDENGKQIGEFQESWFLKFVHFLKDSGVENLGEIKFEMPNGSVAKYLPEYDNWEFK